MSVSSVTVVKIPTSRNRRERSIAVSFVRFDKSSKRIESVICHKHYSGYLLIALNKLNLPVKAWTTNKAYIPIKAKFVSDESVLRDLVKRVLLPRRVYMNDATLLAPFTRDDSFEVIFYEGSLSNVMKSLNSEAFANGDCGGAVADAPRTDDRMIPTFEFVKKLDNSITYKDYK